MTNPNPATPDPKSATPGQNEPGTAAPSATPTPTTSAAGGQPEGSVTIPTKEYAQLQRDAARVRSADRRTKIAGTRTTQPAGSGDPAVDEQIQQANEAKTEAENRAFKAEVKAGVRDILDKPEYASIPKSTRDLITKNPASLSDAKDVETALLDIEDFLIEQASFVKTDPTTTRPATSTQPANTETPPKPGAGGPENIPADAGEEDTTNLRGSARTRAMIRNKVKAGKK